MSGTFHVVNQLFGGRALVGYTEEGERIGGWSEAASKSIRATKHRTGRSPYPRRPSTGSLGDFKGAGHPLPEGLEQPRLVLQASCRLSCSPGRRARRPSSGRFSSASKGVICERGQLSTTRSQTARSCPAPGDAVMAAVTIAGRSPVLRARLLEAAAVVPGLMISALISFVILAALPLDIALGVVTGMLVMSILVGSARLEGWAVRILYLARRPTALEARRIAGPLRLVAYRSGREDLRVLIGRGAGPVNAVGRRHVIIARWVMNVCCTGRVSQDDLAAFIARGVGRLRHGKPRLDLLVTLWTGPWDVLHGLVAGVGRRLSWVPLGRLVWRARFVVATIAVVLEARAGRWPSPIIIGFFITLSYLMPIASQAWQRHLNIAADLDAAKLGLGWTVESVRADGQCSQPSCDTTGGPNPLLVGMIDHRIRFDAN